MIKGAQLKTKYRPHVLEVKFEEERLVHKITNPRSLINYIMDA
jgi:hypothetical protein